MSTDGPVARAYIYSGDWVSDCPRACGNAEFLHDLTDPRDARSPRTVRKPGFYCSYCGQSAEIEWPSAVEMAALMAVLETRPIPHTRNWYPADHPTAVKFRVPHGQSVEDLILENQEHGVMDVMLG